MSLGGDNGLWATPLTAVFVKQKDPAWCLVREMVVTDSMAGGGFTSFHRAGLEAGEG